MTDGDRLRSILSARDGETVYEAAERVVRERDLLLGQIERSTRQPGRWGRLNGEWHWYEQTNG